MRNVNRDKVRQWFWWAAVMVAGLGVLTLCFTSTPYGDHL
jgi:hypothetical protein